MQAAQKVCTYRGAPASRSLPPCFGGAHLEALPPSFKYPRHFDFIDGTLIRQFNRPVYNCLARAMVRANVHNLCHKSTGFSAVSVLVAGELRRANHSLPVALRLELSYAQ